jgi:hypothetical protein
MISAAIGLALAGCSSREMGGVPEPVAAAALDRIDYEAGPCFGACPVFRFTLTADGKGTFVGMRNTAVAGERLFAVTPAEYRAFADRIAPYRPEMGDRIYQPGSDLCRLVATDMPSVDVQWRTPRKLPQRLYYYFGCDRDKNGTMASALGDAIETLPALEALVGERP